MRGYLFPIKRALAIAAACLIVLTPVVAAGHDDDSDDGNHHDETEYGAYIYEGTCDHISTDAFVADIGDLERDAGIWRVVGQGTPTPGAVYGEDEDINDTIEDLIANDHVLVVRAADSQRAPVIACGEITGTPDATGILTIDLHEVDRSGVEGRAMFEPNRDREEPTEVTTAVWQKTNGTPIATPSVVPTSTATP